MTNDSESRRRNNGDESDNLKMTKCRESYALGFGALGASSNIRKSEQLEKLTPTPSAQRKSDRIEKPSLQSPLRRSERGESPSLSSSSSGSNKRRKVEIMDKRVDRNIEEPDVEPVQMKKKRLDARDYRASFSRQSEKIKSAGHLKEMDRSDKWSQRHSNNCTGSILNQANGGNECTERKEEELGEEHVGSTIDRAVEGLNFRLNKFEKKTLENYSRVLSHSSPTHSCAEEVHESEDGSHMQVSKNGASHPMSSHGDMVKGMSNEAERAQVDCCAVEKLQTTQLIGCFSNGRTLHGDVGLESGDQVTSKRKINAADMDFETSTMVASIDICTSIADSNFSSPSGHEKNNSVETCDTFSKRQRVNHGSTKHELSSRITKSTQGLHDNSITKDRGLRPGVPEIENDEVVKKHKEVASNSVDHSSPKSAQQENIVAGSSEVIPEVNEDEKEDGRKLSDALKGLHILLKPESSKLCETLRLNEDVKGMVEQLLEYITNNHHISREPTSILQAFQISLCLTAASLLKHKIDLKESLALAKLHLNFSCQKEEVDLVFSKLLCLKSIFLYHTGCLKVANSPNTSTLSPKDHSHARVSLSTTSNLKKVNVEVDDWSSSQEYSDKQITSQEEWALVSKLVQKDISRSIKQIQKTCRKQMRRLIRKQQEEIKELNRIYKDEKEELKKAYKVETLVIHSLLGNNISMRADRVKILDSKHAKRFEEHKQQMNLRLKDLEAMHLAAKKREQQREGQWVKKVKSWAKVELLDKVPLNEPWHGVKYLQTSEQAGAHTGYENVALVSGYLSGDNNSDGIFQDTPVDELGPSQIPQTVADESIACTNPIEAITLLEMSDSENDELAILASAGKSATLFQENNRVSSPDDIPKQIGLMNPCSEEQGLDVATISMPDGEVPSEVAGAITLPNCFGNDIAVDMRSSGEQISDGTTFSLPDGQLPVGVPKTASSSDIPENFVSINLCSPEEWPSDGAILSMPEREFLLEAPETVISSVDPHSVVSLCPPSEEQVRNEVTFSLPDGEITGVSKTATFSVGPPNAVSINPPLSAEHIPNGAVPSGMPKTAAGVLEGGNVSRESNEACVIGKPHTAEANKQDEVGCNINQHPLFQDRSLVHSPMVSGGPLLPNQAPEDEWLSPRSIPSHSVDSVPTNQSHLEAPIEDAIVELQISPSIVDSPSSGQNMPHFPSTGGTQHQGISEDHTSFQIAQSWMWLLENSQRHPNQTAPPVASRTPLHLYPDPLQNEMERLRRETEQTIKIHEDAKLQVKSNCDKEIEQIRIKYGIKLQEMEADFIRKKKDLDENHNMVLMNRMVANAFRSKCMDVKACGSPGMQQDVTSSFRQQLDHQHTAQRPSLIPCPSLAASLQCSMPPIQVAHDSSVLFSSLSTRPPHIRSFSPSAGNFLQVGSEIRAPAPHLHHSRPPTSISMTSISSFPREMPSNPPATSLLMSPATSLTMSQRPPQLAPMTYQCGPYNRALHSESMGRLPTLSSSSPSALDLFIDADNRAGANIQTNFPSVRDLDSISGTLNLSEFHTRSTVQVTPANRGGANDIVCLSDDD